MDIRSIYRRINIAYIGFCERVEAKADAYKTERLKLEAERLARAQPEQQETTGILSKLKTTYIRACERNNAAADAYDAERLKLKAERLAKSQAEKPKG